MLPNKSSNSRQVAVLLVVVVMIVIGLTAALLGAFEADALKDEIEREAVSLAEAVQASAATLLPKQLADLEHFGSCRMLWGTSNVAATSPFLAETAKSWSVRIAITWQESCPVPDRHKSKPFSPLESPSRRKMPWRDSSDASLLLSPNTKTARPKSKP